MIELHMIQGRISPILCCDICKERIENAKLGAIVFPNFQKEGTRFNPIYVHKSVEGRKCHAIAEAQLKKEHEMVGWLELRGFFANTLHNAGYTSEDIADEMDNPVSFF